MTPTVFLILCSLIVCIYSAEIKGDVALGADCPTDCDVEHCPTCENYNHSCKKSVGSQTLGNKCGFNHSRAKNGTCIPTRHCPAFPCSRPNEESVTCPPYCPSDDCSQATPDGRCPLPGNILVVVQCRPACRCIKGYWRKEGVCVPYDQCPSKDKNESLSPFLQFFNY